MHERHPDDLPTLQEALNSSIEETTGNITIPVLNEIIENEYLENTLLDNLDLNDELRQRLVTHVTELVQQKLTVALPAIMKEVEREISQTIQQQVASRLPEILNDALKNPTK